MRKFMCYGCYDDASYADEFGKQYGWHTEMAACRSIGDFLKRKLEMFIRYTGSFIHTIRCTGFGFPLIGRLSVQFCFSGKRNWQDWQSMLAAMGDNQSRPSQRNP